MALPKALQRRHRVGMLLPGLPQDAFADLGHYRYARADEILTDHAHIRAMEICFLVRGQQTFRVYGRDYRMQGGDIFIAFPQEVHSSGGTPLEKGELYWLILGVPKNRTGFLNLPVPQSRALLRQLLALKKSGRHFRGTWKMKDLLDAVLTHHDSKPDPLLAFHLANRVGAFLLEVLQAAKETPARPAPAALEPALRHIRENLTEPLRVPELAATTGLSVPRFKARFKLETGVPPGEYVLRAKVEEARRRLLAKRYSVTRIAYDLGFSSSQYFATVYKRFTNEQPSQTRGE